MSHCSISEITQIYCKINQNIVKKIQLTSDFKILRNKNHRVIVSVEIKKKPSQDAITIMELSFRGI